MHAIIIAISIVIIIIIAISIHQHHHYASYRHHEFRRQLIVSLHDVETRWKCIALYTRDGNELLCTHALVKKRLWQNPIVDVQPSHEASVFELLVRHHVFRVLVVNISTLPVSSSFSKNKFWHRMNW